MKKREEAVIQNLKDAGCDSDTIACFMLYFELQHRRHRSLSSR